MRSRAARYSSSRRLTSGVRRAGSKGLGDRLCTTPSIICSAALVCAAVSRSLRPCTADSTCFAVGMPDSHSVCACTAPLSAAQIAAATNMPRILLSPRPGAKGALITRAAYASVFAQYSHRAWALAVLAAKKYIIPATPHRCHARSERKGLFRYPAPDPRQEAEGRRLR
ncbi:hypothetical protein METUNv1_00437 [Methyloversatilis universalis FAM5]|uniref:Uncharacterized protein n=1 Tax=Methyloversatilis universalis (strain ATCC BAA-1314 / DSM 25237 / JCM 13912 / CCUG 52030 / FAM5) TaxID=1000565 RepID=F5R8G1_METUF|nr:hypothetical protein METUNv1_00437 [Methyloversatilis universalis FAM5]